MKVSHLHLSRSALGEVAARQRIGRLEHLHGSVERFEQRVAAQIADEYRRSFRILRSLPCDIPLGSHPAMYGMAEKYAKLGKGPNPFIDPQGYKTEVNLMEQVFNTEVARQQKEAAAH